MQTTSTHTQLADAAGDMMRAYALVAARAAAMSASRSISLWALMLAASARSPWAMQSRLAWNPLQGWAAAWSNACRQSSRPLAEDAPNETRAEALSPDPAFASYRSAGGHAVAQIIAD
jgi:hypothetical protein